MSLFDRLFRRSAPTDGPWVTYRSPAGFFSLQHPAAWSVTVKDNIVNICPDQTGAITVSAFHGTPPVPNFAQKWLADTFEKEDALSELEEVANNGWTGFRQGFASVGSAEPRAWVAIVATLEPVFVLITANDTPARFRERAEVYGRVLESLHLFRPGGDRGARITKRR